MKNVFSQLFDGFKNIIKGFFVMIVGVTFFGILCLPGFIPWIATEISVVLAWVAGIFWLLLISWAFGTSE